MMKVIFRVKGKNGPNKKRNKFNLDLMHFRQGASNKRNNMNVRIIFGFLVSFMKCNSGNRHRAKFI